jgi:Protein of unknown function (DUF2782)
MKHLVALTFVCLVAPCWAQPAPSPAPVPSAAAQATERGEPNVKYTLIEDEGSKIDELRVRGQLQHVIVTPKVGFTKRYEIIVSRSGRDPVDGTGGANSALGKRVWNVLDF